MLIVLELAHGQGSIFKGLAVRTAGAPKKNVVLPLLADADSSNLVVGSRTAVRNMLHKGPLFNEAEVERKVRRLSTVGRNLLSKQDDEARIAFADELGVAVEN